MPRSIVACLLAVTLSAATAAALAPPHRPMTAEQMARLVERLGDRSFRARQAAEAALRSQGAAALPALRKALGHADPEVRRRALALVPALEHALLVAPKRVTLVCNNLTLTQFLERLSKESGYKVQSQDGFRGPFAPPVPAAAKAKAEARYSYAFVNAPFWEILDRVCRDASLVVQPGWGDETVRLYRAGSVSRFTGHDGAFRYTATNLQLQRSVDLSTSAPADNSGTLRSESLTLNFQLYAEPRLPFLSVGEPRVDVAYDEERNSMVRSADANGPEDQVGGVRIARRYYGGHYKQFTMQTSLPLERRSAKATTLKLLRGAVPVTLLVRQEPIVISDKVMSAKGAKKVAGDIEFNIQEVKNQNGQIQVKFQATNRGNLTDYSWTNNLYNRVELQDAKGVKFSNWGSSWHGGGGNSVTMTLTFNGQVGGNKAGAATKLVYMHWVTRQHEVNFELRDVPLP